MPIYALGDHVPDIHPDAYVHPDAVVIGQVALRRRFGDLRTRETLGPVARVALVSVVAGGVGWFVLRMIGLDGASMAGSLARVLVGTVVIGAAALAGLVVARVPELQGPLATVRSRIGRG